MIYTATKLKKPVKPTKSIKPTTRSKIPPEKVQQNLIIPPIKPLIVRPSPSPLLPYLIPTLNFGDKIGEGAYGVIYKGDKDNIAIKVIPDKIQSGIESPLEIDILTRIRHPNILYSDGLEAIGKLTATAPNISQLAIKMPLANSDLRHWLKRHELNVKEKLSLMFQIANGLNFLHKNSILHLDLNNSNILVYENSDKTITPKIADFGLSIRANRSLYRRMSRTLVTMHYRAPEVNPPCFYNDKTDVWSLGLIFIKIITNSRVRIFNDLDGIPKDCEILFHENNIRDTLNKFLVIGNSNNLGEFEIPILELIELILKLENCDRPSVEQILENPVFSSFKIGIPSSNIPPSNIPSSNIPPHITPSDQDLNVTNYPLEVYSAFNFFFSMAYQMNVKVETVFLTCDLFQRSLKVLPLSADVTKINGDTFDKTKANIETYLNIIITCYWISIKMIEDLIIDSQVLVNVAPNMLSSYIMGKLELQIIILLKGVLYLDNLYTVSSSLETLIEGFEVIRNPFQYSNIDLNQWKLDHLKMDSNRPIFSIGKEDDRFTSFFERTYYYSEKVKIKARDGNVGAIFYLQDIENLESK